MTLHFSIKILCNLHNFTIHMAALKCQWLKAWSGRPSSGAENTWILIPWMLWSEAARFSGFGYLWNQSFGLYRNFVGASDSQQHHTPISSLCLLRNSGHGKSMPATNQLSLETMTEICRNMPKWHLCSPKVMVHVINASATCKTPEVTWTRVERWWG